MTSLPPQIVKDMDLKKGDQFYCYPGRSNNLVYSRDKSSVTVHYGLYKIIRTDKKIGTFITVPPAWLRFHNIESRDKVEICMGKGTFTVKKISEEIHGTDKE